MAAALIGLVRPVRIEGASVVAKSFPGFFRQWPGSAARPW
jgi:5-enolpyruvylshikimate-3-phosphate synthase